MPQKFTVVTYNIRHGLNIDGKHCLDDIANTLASCLVRTDSKSFIHQADSFARSSKYAPCVICLQEVDSLSPRTHFQRQAHILAAKLGLSCIYSNSMSALGLFGFGNAILTNCTIHSTWNRRLPVKHAEPRKLIYASLDIEPKRTSVIDSGYKQDKPASKCLSVFNTHWGLKSSDRIKAAKLSAKLVRNLDGYPPTLYCGDLNVSVDSDEAQLLIHSTGLESVGCEQKLLTYPSDTPKHRIDHILYSRGLTVENVRVINSNASDHLPLVARLSLNFAETSG